MKLCLSMLCRAGWIGAIAASILHCSPAFSADDLTATSGRQPRVLILYSNERLLPANIVVDEAIRATFAAGIKGSVEFYNEFLDVDRFPSEALQERDRDFLRDKYSERPPDLIIAGGGPALAFLLKFRATVFTEVPVVHCAVSLGELPKTLPDDRIVGVPNVPAVASTLELVLRLQPDTRRVAMVASGSELDPHGTGGLSEEVSHFEKMLTFTWLTNQSLPELRHELSRLPDHTVVLYSTMFRDTAGNTFTPRAALAEFAPASRVPIYGYYDTYLGYGIVGGSMVTFENIGRVAAQIGIRILAGEKPQAAARTESQQPVSMFDWRELQRWNISESRLPSGSVVRFHPPTLWEHHKDYVIGGVCIFVGQAVTIVALLLQRARRRRAEVAARENEERMALAVNAAELGLWEWDMVRDEFWSTEKGRAHPGFTRPGRMDFKEFLQSLHPDDREPVSHALAKSMNGDGDFESEYRVMLPGQPVSWMVARGRMDFNAAGKPVFMRGVSLDITQRKRTEHEVAEQRNEVAHLARVTTVGEISGSLAHELNQPLGAILANTEAAEMHLQKQPPNLDEVRAILADIRKDDIRAGEIIHGMRAFLRRRELEIQPLVLNQLASEAIRLVSADAATRKITIGLEIAPNFPRALGDRIHLQQVLINLLVNGMDAMTACPVALRRIVIQVTQRAADMLEIAVSDAGTGISPGNMSRVFDPFHTTKPHGLGLGLAICRSIVEAHGGSITIENNPDRGAITRFTLKVFSEQPPQ